MANSNSLIFAAARVKSNENKLLGADKLTRLLDCATLSDAVKVLAESNYGGGLIPSAPHLYDEILNAETAALYAFFAELKIDGRGMEAFYVQNDYHNAKALMKAKYGGGGEVLPETLSAHGTIDTEFLTDCIMHDNYSELPAEMRGALEGLDTAFADGVRSPSSIDNALDKAGYLAAAKVLAKRHSTESIRKYFSAKADLANLLTFYRVKRNALAYSVFTVGFMPTGSLPQSFFERLWEATPVQMADAFARSPYRAVFEAAEADAQLPALVTAEAKRDDYLLNFFRAKKDDLQSIDCIAYFYLVKQRELSNVRVILTGIKNQIDVAAIKARIRAI